MNTRQIDELSRMGKPRYPELPFFAYGLFKPGQICHFRIKKFIKSVSSDSVNGTLFIRDGIPLLKTERNNYGKVQGVLISFYEEYIEEAYRRIIEIEPEKVYRWDLVQTDCGIKANVLLGRKPDKGSSYYEKDNWDGSNDPFFKEAIETVKEINSNNMNFGWDFKALFNLQMAYYLLWTSIERYASLKYHLGHKVMQKIMQIADEGVFAESLKKYVNEKREVFDSGNQDKAALDSANPHKSLEYYYMVRSNSVHRGKAVFEDFDILKKSLTELTLIFEDLLKNTFYDQK